MALGEWDDGLHEYVPFTHSANLNPRREVLLEDWDKWNALEFYRDVFYLKAIGGIYDNPDTDYTANYPLLF